MAVKIELLLSVHCIQNTILHSDNSFVVQLTVHINKQVFRRAAVAVVLCPLQDEAPHKHSICQ